MSVRRSRWSWSVPVAFKHLSTFISGSRKIISEHQCLTGLGEGEGRSFGFVLFDQPTGQKQGEGKWTERLEFTLDRSHRTQSQQAGEADRNCHTRCSHIPLKPNKERRKDKIVGGGEAQRNAEVATKLTHIEKTGQPPGPLSHLPSPLSISIYRSCRAQTGSELILLGSGGSRERLENMVKSSLVNVHCLSSLQPGSIFGPLTTPLYPL